MGKMHSLLLACLGLLFSLNAAAGLNERLTAVQDYLDAGKGDKAVEALREIQTDFPDSALVAYAMGAAQCKRASQQQELGAVEEAAAAYGEARTAFELAAKSENPVLAREAAFALSNAIAKRALALPAKEKRAEAIQALREAIDSYESLLKRYPGLTAAQKNLDNVQFQLKKILQESSPQQQDQKKDDQNKQQPATVYFLEAGTDLPNATAKSEENRLELVIPDKPKEAQP